MDPEIDAIDILQTIGLHLDLWYQTIFNLNWWKTKTWDILSNSKTRLIIWLLIFILNIIAYLITPQNHSSKTSWYIPYWSYKTGWTYYQLSYRNKLRIIAYLIIIIDIGFFYYLTYNNQLLSSLPNTIWIGIAILGISIISLIYNKKKPIQKDGTFNPPPSYIMPQNKRIIVYLALSILYLTHFITEYKLGYVPEIANNLTGFKQTLFSRFHGYLPTNSRNQKIIFATGWSRLIGLIITFLGLYSTYYFAICPYNLPSSWQY